MAKLTDTPRTTEKNPSARRDNLRAWCEETNRKRFARITDRWYFVVEKDGFPIIDCLQGTDGANVHRWLENTLPDFVGWGAARMAGYRDWLRDCAIRGVSEETAAEIGQPKAT